jgi:hypothetical protein
LKQKIGIIEKEDEELAKQETEKIEVLLSMEFHAWQVVKEEKARALLLDHAELGGADKVEEWLRLHRVSSVPVYFK